MRVKKSGGCSGMYGSLIKANPKPRKDPVYRSHKAYFEYGPLYIATWTERQLSIIAGEFDNQEVKKKEVEYILDKAEYLDMTEIYETVYERFSYMFLPKKKSRKVLTVEEIDRRFADLERRMRSDQKTSDDKSVSE